MQDVSLTLVGGPTVLIEINGFRLLTDPTFDRPGVYPAGAITLEKLQGPAVAREDIGPLDAVLLSHDQHWDNLDRSGRELLGTTKTLTTKVGATRLGGSAVGLAPWENTTLENAAGQRLIITATPARHGPVGIEPISGDVVGFAVGVKEPGDALYISGDTVWYEGTAEIARRFRPRLLVLFTGAAQPRGSFHMTMGANDAIDAAHAFPQAKLVAVHNDSWAHFKESQDDLAKSLMALGLGERFTALQPGTRQTIQL